MNEHEFQRLSGGFRRLGMTGIVRWLEMSSEECYAITGLYRHGSFDELACVPKTGYAT